MGCLGVASVLLSTNKSWSSTSGTNRHTDNREVCSKVKPLVGSETAGGGGGHSACSESIYGTHICASVAPP